MQRLLFPTLASLTVTLVAVQAFVPRAWAASSERTTSFGVDLFAGGHYFAEGTNLGVAPAPDASSGARGNGLVGLRASMGLNQWSALEVELLGMLTSDRTYGRRASILGYRLNAVAYLMAGNLRPFVLLGAGVIEVVTTHADANVGLVRDRDGEYHVGAGIEYRILNHLSVRADVRVVQMPGKQLWSLASDLEGMVGAVVPFGAGPRVVPQAEPLPAVQKSVSVAAQGEPAVERKGKKVAPVASAELVAAPSGSAEEAPVSPAASSEKTRVSETTKSPTLAAAAAPPNPERLPKSEVAERPAVLASDGAVAAVKDLLSRSKEIRFNGATSKLSLVSLPFIGALAEALVKEPDVEIEIVSHVAGRGNRQKELILSKRRAAAVKKALVQREVRADRLTVVGRGSEEPIAPNVTSSGRRLNERMDLRIAGSK